MKGAPFLQAQDQLSFRSIPAAGTLLRAQTSEGDFLAHVVSEGPQRPLAFRVLSRERHPDFTPRWWAGQVEQALGRRRALSERLGEGPRRLIQAEADGLPGLLCDLWAPGVAALSVESPGALATLEFVEEALIEQAKLKSLWRRLPLEGRGGGLTPWHASPLTPKAVKHLEIREGAGRLSLDFEGQQLPPMERRAWRAWCTERAKGRSLLCWGETPWEIQAAESAGALRVESLKPDAFKRLEAMAEKGLRFDLALAVLPAEAKYRWGRFVFNKQGQRVAQLLKALVPEGDLLLAGLPQEGLPQPGLDLEAGALAWAPLAPPPDLPPLGPGFSPVPPAWTASVAQA